MNNYGFKILHNGSDYFLCLLDIPKDSKIIGNDYKYRTNKVYVCDIRRISTCKSQNEVLHNCFFDLLPIKYQINKYIEAELDTTPEICAPGIHYFPFTTSIDHIHKYFINHYIDWEKVASILIIWCIKIVYRKTSTNNLLNIINGSRYPLTLFSTQKENNIIYNFIKKDT